MREVGVGRSVGLLVLETSDTVGEKVLWMKTDCTVVPPVLSGLVAEDNPVGD